MKMFTDCSGECCICGCDFCLAGHGDDDYYPATADQVIKRLDNNEYSNYRQMMIDYLRSRYGYVYGKGYVRD